jgi:hypothetical protein
MKKVYLTTTALVAVGAAVSQPAAADGLKVGIAGFYRGAPGITAGRESFDGPAFGLGDGDRSSGGFRQEIRINITSPARRHWTTASPSASWSASTART